MIDMDFLDIYRSKIFTPYEIGIIKKKASKVRLTPTERSCFSGRVKPKIMAIFFLQRQDKDIRKFNRKFLSKFRT